MFPSSAVTSRFGRILLFWLSPPDEKSAPSSLAEDDVAASEGRQYQSGPPLRVAQVEKREVEVYDIASYRSARKSYQPSRRPHEPKTVLGAIRASRVRGSHDCWQEVDRWCRRCPGGRCRDGFRSGCR